MKIKIYFFVIILLLSSFSLACAQPAIKAFLEIGYSDKDYIELKADKNDDATIYHQDSLTVNIENKEGGAVDWMAFVYAIPKSEFSSVDDLRSKIADNRALYGNFEEKSVGVSYAGAKSYFRYVDLIDVASNYLTKSLFGAEDIEKSYMPYDANNVYLVRAYSGGFGLSKDDQEWKFVSENVKNGKSKLLGALLTNIALGALDTAQAVVKIPVDQKIVEKLMQEAVKEGMVAAEEYLVAGNGLGLGEILKITYRVSEKIVVTAEKELAKNTAKSFLKQFAERTKYIIKAIDITPKIASGLKAANRATDLALWATPVETSYVYVNDGSFGKKKEKTDFSAALRLMDKIGGNLEFAGKSAVEHFDIIKNEVLRKIGKGKGGEGGIYGKYVATDNDKDTVELKKDGTFVIDLSYGFGMGATNGQSGYEGSIGYGGSGTFAITGNTLVLSVKKISAQFGGFGGWIDYAGEFKCTLDADGFIFDDGNGDITHYVKVGAKTPAQNQNAAGSPSQTLLAFYEAMKNRDYDAFIALIDPDQLGTLKFTRNEFMNDPHPNGGFAGMEITGEKITGDTAEVCQTTKYNNGAPESNCAQLVKKNGRWLITGEVREQSTSQSEKSVSSEIQTQDAPQTEGVPVESSFPLSEAEIKSVQEKGTVNATIDTSLGSIKLQLACSQTPKTVANFIHLAKNGFYDNLKFHRVIKDFMIQGGDPLSKDDARQKDWGTGGPGYKFADEPFSGEYKRGVLAMANSGQNTNGSQFFIMHRDYPLPSQYVIFGKVVSGMDVVDAIASAPTDSVDRPLSPIVIKSIMIEN